MRVIDTRCPHDFADKECRCHRCGEIIKWVALPYKEIKLTLNTGFDVYLSEEEVSIIILVMEKK